MRLLVVAVRCLAQTLCIPLGIILGQLIKARVLGWPSAIGIVVVVAATIYGLLKAEERLR